MKTSFKIEGKMLSIAESLREMSELVKQLDEEDFEFQTQLDASSISPRAQRHQNDRTGPNRRKSSAHKKEGREKFEARRKVKRLNRLVNEIEKKGYDVTDLIEEGKNKPLVRVEEATKKLYVDRPAAELDWKEGESTVVVEVDDEVVTKKIPFNVESVEREIKDGITVFQLS